MTISTSAFSHLGARWHLRAEMAELVEQLAGLLARQRARGRTPAADRVRGMVIEQGEAEGLLTALRSQWSDATEPGPRLETQRPGSEPSPVARWVEQAEARGVFLPLRQAAKAFDLSPDEYRILLLALAIEIDPRFGRMIAYLNDHVSLTSPTLGLAFSLAAAAVEIPAGLPERPLFRDGLLEMHGDGPLPGRAARLNPSMIGRLTGVENAGSIPAPLEIRPLRQSGLGELVLESGLRRSLAALVENIRTVPGTPSWTLLLAGKKGSGRTAIANAIAGELRLPLVTGDITQLNQDEELKRIRRECRWHKAAPLVKIAGDLTAQDWRRLWLDLPVPCPLLFVELSAGDAAAALETHPDHAVTIEIPEPGRPERLELWSRRLPRGHSLSQAELERLAARFAFSPGLIAQAVRRARADLALRPAGQRRLDFAAVSHAARAMGAARMGAVAERLPLPFTFRDLVVPDEIREEFLLILAWVRHERRVLDEWGLGRRIPYGHGLAALLCGPPGTGKTMASQALARELDLDLYRVDLSQLMSKYIGETEKNLSRLFDEAHASGAVLFFDEADAIFGKRSEVKDARDRYANVEIGYLLQRMEAHDGVTLLATNRRQDLDEAFVRRFHSIVSFPMPSEQSRLRIWQGMLPEELEREAELDLPLLAKHFEISGGEIRNCVMAACYMAAAEGRPLGMPHLKRALRRELRKCGRFAGERDLRMLDE